MTTISLLQLLHCGFVMKGTLEKRARQCSAMERVASKAVSEKEAAEKELAEANARWAKAVEERLAARSAAEASRAEADSSARKVSDLEGELVLLRAGLEAEMATMADLRSSLADAKAEAARAEKMRDEVVSRSAEQSALLESLSSRLAAAERGVEAAKVEAVESFKNSQDFTDAVAECSAESYQLGFADCKEATARLFPALDLSRVTFPDGEEEGEEEVVGEQAIDSAPVDVPAEVGEQVLDTASADVPAEVVEEDADPGS